MAERQTRLKRLRIAVPILLIAIIAVVVWRQAASAPETPDAVIAVSGRIEGDEAAVAAKTTGRILEITVREGDQLNAGQLIATLEDDQIHAREEQAAASVQQAEARLRLARQQIDVLTQQLRQAQLSIEQAQTEARGRVREAEANLAAAEAALAQAQANYDLALYDRNAYANLAKSGAVSERAGRQAASAAEAQAAVVESARRRVEAARGTLGTAKSTLVNPDLRSLQAAAVQDQIRQAQAEIAAGQAEVQRARARLQEAQAARADLKVFAPFAGTVAMRTAEPGEVATPGTPIITLVDLNRVYLRGFVPEGQIGRVRVGQAARVYLDSAPEKALAAYVSRVDPQASFTPENTYFREDRVKQVVGVKLQLREGAGFAKPGMPADGLILLDGQEWPEGVRP
jgi:HlyD family secretion protein